MAELAAAGSGIRVCFQHQRQLLSVDHDANYDVALRVNHYFANVDTVVQFSVFGDLKEGETLTTVVNDVMGVPRRIAVPPHIQTKLSVAVLHMIKAKIPFGMRHFLENVTSKSAEDLIESLCGTSGMLGQEHADLLEARLKALTLESLAQWPVVRAQFKQLHSDYSKALQAGRIQQEGQARGTRRRLLQSTHTNM